MEASIDAAIADLAAAQHGAVSRSQSRRLGLSPQAAKRRVTAGRLHAPSPLAFTVPGSVPTCRQRLLVAVFDAGEGAVATRRSAAALHQLPGFGFGVPEVLVKRAGDHVARLGRLSETSWLPPEHVTARDSIPVVTLPRLCFELAATEKRGRLTRIVDDAQLLGMSIDALADVVGCLAKRGRPGSTAMREEVEARGEGYVPPASELEALGFEVLRNGGLPEPVRQVNVGGEQWVGRVDCAYLDERLIIEFDGRRHWQASLEAEADRRRDAELVAAGWRVLRITWKMLTEDPEGVVRLVRAALDANRRSQVPVPGT
jgi:very-short-patch-repair endonuclease